jgi:hypothetical protein
LKPHESCLIASFSCQREELCRFAQIVGPTWRAGHLEEDTMHGLIYLVGLIVVILAVLSFFGLR